MPHSSGGGGGSFSSRSSSSRSGGSHYSSGGASSTYIKTPSIATERSPGLTKRYVYYRRGKPRYIYSDMAIDKKEYDHTSPDYILSIIGIVLAFIISAVLLLFSYRFEHNKLIMDDYDTKIYINDAINAIDDVRLYDVFVDFQNKTGITPAFLSISDENCLNSTDIEKYAYNAYVDTWKDEKHWLIVYNQVDELNRWEFVGMQGDDTDILLDDYVLDAFNGEVIDSIQEKHDITKAFVNAFKHATEKAMYHGVIYENTYNVGLGFIGLGVVILMNFVRICIRNKKEKLYIVPNGKNESITVFCKKCGGEFVRGMHKYCPYCKAKQ